MSTPLEKQLIERVSAGERIGVDTLMHTALLNPDHGYYTKQRVFGKDGDFTTAPEISQIFGEVIAAYLAANIGPMQATPALVELGPGRGALMADMLRSFQAMPDNMQPDEVVMVEASAQMIATQKTRLAQSYLPIRWQGDVDNLPKKPCMIVGNEFLDALPIQQFVRENDAWMERVLGVEGGSLMWKTAPIDGTVGGETAPPLPPPQAGGEKKEPEIFEHSQASCDVMQALSTHIHTYGGMMVLVDYGYADPAFGDTLQAVKGHKYVDVLRDIGEADITAHVNFAAMQAVAEKAGLTTHVRMPQGAFLRNLGAQIRAQSLCEGATREQQLSIVSGVERLIAPEQMGQLFKVLVVAHPSLTRLDIGT